MRRAARTLIWSIACLFGLISLLTLVVWLTVSSTAGSRFVFTQVAGLLDDQLVIAGIEGAITGPLTIRGLQFNSASVNVEVDQVDFDWLPDALLFSPALVRIKNLELRGLRVVLPQSEASTSAKSTAGLPDDLKLPVEIRIDNFTLANGSIASGTDELISLQSVQATSLLWDGDGIGIPQLSVRTSFIDLTASGRVLPEANWPLALDARYSLDLQAQQLPNVSGSTVLSGSLAQLEIVQHLGPPYEIRVEASVSEPLVAPQWQAVLQATKPQLAAFDTNLPAVDLTAKLTAQGDTTKANIVADLEVAESSVQLSGRINLAEQSGESPSVDLGLAWQQVTWPLDAKDNYLVASATGNAQLTGVLDAYRATVDAQVAVPAYPAGALTLAGSGSRRGFAVEELALSVLGGRVQGTASVDWASGLETSFNLVGENLDPAGVNANWPGRLGFIVQGDAGMDAGGTGSAPRVNLLSLVVEGVLRGEPISVGLSGHLDESGLTLPSLVVRALGSTLEAQGTIAMTAAQPIDFQWQLATNDLGGLASGLSGKVQAIGSLGGTFDEPRIQASLTATDIVVTQVQIDRAELTADLGLGTSPLSLNANIDGLQLGGAQVGKVEFDLSGTLAQHVLGLRTAGDTGTNQLGLSGSLSNLPTQGTSATIAQWSNASWRFSLNELDINQGDIAIDLIQAVEPGYVGKIDSEAISIDDTCFSFSGASPPSQDAVGTQHRICAQASGTYADEFTSRITFNSVPLMLLDPLLPEALGLNGDLNGAISLGWNMATNTPRANIQLDTSATDLGSTNRQGEVQTLLRFAPGKLNAIWTNDALLADITLPLEGAAGLQATASLLPAGDGEFTSRRIDANVIAKFDDLDWMSDFVPGVTQLRGELESNVHIGGTVAGPNLTGSLSLKKGTAVLPEPGLTLRELNIDITGAGDTGLSLAGSVKSGGGTLSVEGQFNDIGSAMTGRMSLTGQRVLILNTPEAEIYASPAISADFRQGHLNLAGEVSVDKADIQLVSLPQTAATVSDDQIMVIMDAPSGERANTFDVTTRLRLILNNAVTFSGFGLEAKFRGDLSLEDLPGKPTTATGNIDVVEGRYRAYGQDLTIETGKLLFVGGPIDQPGIDVRAVRQPTPDIKVGVLARGSLNAPEFAIFSEPPMNQSDQLAYLILGRSIETSSSGESSALSRAALALGIKGGNYLTEQFGSKLRVDKIGIEASAGEANDQAALVVGKYLSPKLFVSYGIGILDAVSTLKIEYLLSSKWRLSSESSAEQGGVDVIYVLER